VAVQALALEVDEPELPLSIPPAVASLTWMEAELQRQMAGNGTEVVNDVASQAEGDALPLTTVRREPAPAPTVASFSHRPTAQPRPVFGQLLAAALPGRRMGRQARREVEDGRDLFSVLEETQRLPISERHSAQDSMSEKVEQLTLF
jgi:hypothetical protein